MVRCATPAMTAGSSDGTAQGPEGRRGEAEGARVNTKSQAARCGRGARRRGEGRRAALVLLSPRPSRSGRESGGSDARVRVSDPPGNDVLKSRRKAFSPWRPATSSTRLIASPSISGLSTDCADPSPGHAHSTGGVSSPRPRTFRRRASCFRVFPTHRRARPAPTSRARGRPSSGRPDRGPVVILRWPAHEGAVLAALVSCTARSQVAAPAASAYRVAPVRVGTDLCDCAVCLRRALECVVGATLLDYPRAAARAPAGGRLALASARASRRPAGVGIPPGRRA